MSKKANTSAELMTVRNELKKEKLARAKLEENNEKLLMRTDELVYERYLMLARVNELKEKVNVKFEARLADLVNRFKKSCKFKK
jgi:hypothetical protein